MAASKSVINVAALCGSLRSASFNRGLIRYAMKLSKEAIEGMEIEYVDISPLPLLNTDLIVGGKFPPAVEAFGQQILKADGLLFATAENNFSVSGVFLDLHYVNKPHFNVNAFQPPPKFDSDGNLIDEATMESLKQVLQALRTFTLRLQPKYITSFHSFKL
uniref:NAD(P)H dehydrogenase (quinone) n=1 Tax=Vitis vinifera TaxID=29760 RepID=A5BJ84_VITVI|nr:hypothetical protein VITISV_020919 [Vitis vinifera]